MDIQIDITGVRLETERLYLRPWREDDLGDLYEYASVPGVGEMAGWPHHESIEVSRKILDSFISDRNVFAMELKENGKVAGSLGLHPSWANELPEFAPLKQKEIGYVLSKAYWGRALTPEAVKRVIGYCFDKLGLDAVTVAHFKTNDRSRRVIEKCGFRFVRSSIYSSKQLGCDFEDMEYILPRPAEK